MYANVFKRIEQKYVITEEQQAELFRRISKHMVKDKFFKSTISTIYFDNENNEMIINAIEKPIYKDKVRLRSYTTPGVQDDVFLEIKNKYKGIVGKRRIKMTLQEFKKYFEEGKYDEKNQIMKEIDYLFKFYNLQPKLFIAYDRQSYASLEDKNLRITFDFNLRSRRNDLKLEDGDYGDSYFEDKKMVIMEIKSLNSIPLWFINALSDMKIYPGSFTKYGNIYKKERLKGECYV